MAGLVGAYAVALASVAVAVIAWRANRRLVLAGAHKAEQEAGQVEDARIVSLRDQLDDEYHKRRAIETELAGEVAKREALEHRVTRLEQQIRSLGSIPCDGGR